MTPLEKFLHWEKTTPNALFLRQPLSGQWKTWTYKEAGLEIRRMATALLNFSFPEQSHVAILSKNCAHWIMADLAIGIAGFISVPIYPTLSASGIRYILEHSESKLIFLGKLDDFERQRAGIPEQVKRISFPFYGPHDGIKWDDLIFHEPLAHVNLPKPDQIASIMYSSGTTGIPKGVMLSYKAFDFVGQSLVKNFGIKGTPRFVSYLPLSHIAEKSYVQMSVLYSGSSISFIESIEKFSDNLREIKPNLFGGVPRIFSKLQDGILSKMPQLKLDQLLSIPIVSGFVKKMIRKKAGFGETILFVGGAAPLPISLLVWFKKIGIPITEVYGMTENCGYSHGDHGSTLHIGTVGRPWPGIEVKLTDDGEILTKHPGLMTGYYKDPQGTSEAFTGDGFLKTGDKGSIDNAGFLTITGRVKDQFKTDKAKYIATAPIELKLLSNKDIEQVCVVGVGIPQPIALIILSVLGKSKSRENVSESLISTIKQVNSVLEHYEKIEKAVVMRGEWTVENGLLTPSLKLKRNELEKIHLLRYPEWYKQETIIIWE
jgi:long-chain acyl-CoA synthetase